MSILISGAVGDQNLKDGANNIGFRQTADGGSVDSLAHGQFYELGGRSQIFECVSSITAGINSTTAGDFANLSGSNNVLFLLENPVNSGVNCSVLKTRIRSRAGTPGVGTFVYCLIDASFLVAVAQNNNGVAGTVPIGSYGGGYGGRCKAYFQKTLGASAPMLLRPLGGWFAAAVAATTDQINLTDNANGDIVVPPGYIVLVAAGGGGTTHSIHISMTWAEIPL